MKLLNWIIKGSIGTFRVLYLLLAVVVILVAAYVLGGYDFLARGAWGTDMTNAFAMAAWVDKYFPHVPFWYPLAGGGASITHSYPVFSFYLVSILKRIVDLNLMQAFRVLGFCGVISMALGIYAFVALRFKNQTAALIAPILYLISPIAWTWLFDWGFYAECVSYIFIMPAIIFWDLFFTSFLKEPRRVRNRLYLMFAAIFLALTIVTHFSAGLGVLTLFGFYILGYTIKEEERGKVFVRGIVALLLVGILALAVSAFTTLPFYRYTKIAAEAGLGQGGQAYEQIKQGTPLLKSVLGFYQAEEGDWYYAGRHISFHAVVSVFAILGVILSLQSSGSLALGLFAAFTLLLTTSAESVFWIDHHIPWPFELLSQWRSAFAPLRLAWPILAALGAVWIFKVPFFWVRGRITGFIKGAVASLVGLVLVALALYHFGHLPKLGIYPFNYGAQGGDQGRGVDPRIIWTREFCSPFEPEWCVGVAGDMCRWEDVYSSLGDEERLEAFVDAGYGAWCHSPLRSYFLPYGVLAWCMFIEEETGTRPPELCDTDLIDEEKVRSLWYKCKEDESVSELCKVRFKSLAEQLLPSGWPEFKINDEFHVSAWLRGILDKISKENPQARIDLSPYVSGLGMITPYINLDSDLSQIFIYTVASSSLNRRFWGPQVSAFYIDDSLYANDPDLVDNLTRWFGIDYIFVEPRANVELLQKAGWEAWAVNRSEEGEVTARVLKFSEENSLVDLSQKATVLVIGQSKKQAYDQVFHLASRGTLPYEDTFVIWGKGTVDGYSLEELRDFDVLVLHGYTYKSWKKANSLLADYVRGGGKLFIDTGWQYGAADWETGDKSQALDVIPFNRLSWLDLGKTGDFVLEDSEFGSGVDVSKFGPLIYEDQPWGVSTSERSDLRDWARVVLSVKDHPLIVAGGFGEGRVVWSGMNVFNHVSQGNTIHHDEIKLLTNLFSWLSEEASTTNFAVSYVRDHPDKVEFTVGEDVPDGSFLLWKEAYHPDFRAQLVTEQPDNQTTSLPIYRAGPSLTSIRVPELKAGDKIVYEYRKPFIEKASLWISVLALLLLPVIVVEGIVSRERSLFLRFVLAMERKIHYLFFGLWRKSPEWWGKGDKDA